MMTCSRKNNQRTEAQGFISVETDWRPKRPLKHDTSFPPRPHGFTLIELLVVVSIIALLVSILLPALGRAKEHARRVTCASQFRQIAIIHTMYAHEFDSWIPRYTYRGALDKPNHAENVRAWPGNMLAEPFEYCRQAFQMNDEIWVCPGFVGRNEDAIVWEAGFEGEKLAKSTTTSGQWPSGYWTLGCVSLVGLTPSSDIQPRNGVPDSALKVSDPGYYLLAADKNYRSKQDWSYINDGSGAPSSAIAHPAGDLPSGGNVAHVDGSVTWNDADHMALNRRTLMDPMPEVIAVDHKDAVGKYDNWPADGREYFF